MHDKDQLSAPPSATVAEAVAAAADFLVGLFGDSNSKRITTMSARQSVKPHKGAVKRKGHLRSKVEKRDEDIIHVRGFARIPSLRNNKDAPDEVLDKRQQYCVEKMCFEIVPQR